MLKSEPLYYLVELAHCRSFRIASENLHITQPALSIAIKKLETELGLTLLERTTKSVKLTEIGQQVVEMSQRVIEQLDAIEQLQSHQIEKLSYDHLHIYTFPALGQGLFYKVYEELRANIPLNQMRIKEVPFQEMMALVLEDKTAFALAWQLREGRQDIPEGIGMHSLYCAKASLMLSTDCSLVAPNITVVSLKDVLDLPIVSFSGGYGVDNQMHERLAQQYGSPDNLIEVPNMSLFDQIIYDGTAVAFGVDISNWKCLKKTPFTKNRFIPLKENIIFDFAVYYNQQCPQALREHVITVFDSML